MRKHLGACVVCICVAMQVARAHAGDANSIGHAILVRGGYSPSTVNHGLNPEIERGYVSGAAGYTLLVGPMSLGATADASRAGFSAMATIGAWWRWGRFVPELTAGGGPAWLWDNRASAQPGIAFQAATSVVYEFVDRLGLGLVAGCKVYSFADEQSESSRYAIAFPFGLTVRYRIDSNEGKR